MLKKRFSFWLGIFLLAFPSITALAHTAEIPDTGMNRYKSVRLTPEIYGHTDGNLSNISIKNEKGETVPYLIHTSYQTVDTVTRQYRLSLTNTFVKEDARYFDYELSASPDHDVIATSIEFTTPDSNFAKRLGILGSYDSIHWEPVQENTIYQVDGNAKLEILLEKPEKYTHYRFRLDHNQEEINFDSVMLHYNTAIREQNYFIETMAPDFHVEEVEKTTVIRIEGMKNLKISDIMLKTDSQFKRTAAVRNKEKQIYNLTFDDINYVDTTISLNPTVFRDDILEVVIYNHDDKPVMIHNVIVTYIADEVVFEGNGSSYTLSFNEDSGTLAPVYDISSYREQILQQPTDRLEIQEIKIQNETENVPEEVDYQFLFNLVIIFVAGLLGIIILMKLRKKS